MLWSRIHNVVEIETMAQQMRFLSPFGCSIPDSSVGEFTPSPYWIAWNIGDSQECLMDMAS